MVGVDASGMRVIVERAPRIPRALDRLGRASDEEVRSALARLLELAGIPEARAARILRCDLASYRRDLAGPLMSIDLGRGSDDPGED